MKRKRILRILPSGVGVLVLALLAASVRLAAAETPPQLTREQMEQFLLNAEVLRMRGVSTGITGTKRATLSDGKLTHDASIQTVDIFKQTHQTARGTELNFRDSYKYNIAAYRLDKLLNLNMVPASVERKIRGHTGAVTWWVDNVQMMEKDRYLKKIEPPDRDLWNDQIYQVRVFNELVYNTDPNLGNLLICDDWDLVMIDFTRAFRIHKKLRNPENLSRIDRGFYNALHELKQEDVERELGPYLRNSEIKALMARRDLIVEFFEAEIAAKGEAAVICDRPGH